MIRKAKQCLRTCIDGMVGNLDVWKWHKENLKTIPSLRQAINTIQSRWKFDNNDLNECPIFIFSAGWRSGSTLLQRMISSSNEVLIWGEPYSNSDYIRKLANSLKIFRKNIPPTNFLVDSFIDENFNLKVDNWVACLYPNPKDLWDAHRAFFKRLFEKPAKNLGYKNWGIKEVRLDIEYAYYLQWLFPNAKFVFLYRNPYEAYRSYRTFGKWYDKWPNEPVFTATKFGLIWKKLLEGFLKEHKSFQSHLLKYENLISKDFFHNELELFLNVQLDKTVLSKKVTGRNKSKIKKIPIIERYKLAHVVEPLAGSMKYTYD
jgi:hypothetical protein